MDSDYGSFSGLPTSKGTYYELKHLQERHKELLRLLVLGVKKKEIRSLLGITTPMILYVENSVLGQEYMETIRAERENDTVDIQKSIDNLAAPAIDVIRQAIAGKMKVDLIDPDTGNPKTIELPIKPTDRIKTSQDILSRHTKGYSPRQRVTNEHTGEITHNLGAMIDNVKERSKELNGKKVIDAEFVETEQIEGAEDSNE